MEDDLLFQRGTPPEGEDEWRRVWRSVHQSEKSSALLSDIHLAVGGLAVLRRTLPWALGIGVILAALVNKEILLRWLP